MASSDDRRRGNKGKNQRRTRKVARIEHPDVEVTVERLVPGGVGLARDEAGIVFVRGGLPGEVVRAGIDKKRGGVRHGRTLEILSPSPDRIAADCPQHPSCGGCDLLDLAQDARPAVKQGLVVDALKRIARLSPEDLEKVAPLRRSPSTEEGARRRARAHVGHNGELGFFAPSSHAVVDTELCRALVAPLHDAWRFVRKQKFVAGSSVEFLAAPNGDVFLASTPENQAALAAAVEAEVAAGACSYAQLPTIEDGEAAPSSAAADAIFSEAHFFTGDRGAEGVIAPYAQGGPFGVDAATFVQASDFGARAIVEEVLLGAFAPADTLDQKADAKSFAEAGPTAAPTTRVLELFAGAGHLSFPLASAGVHVAAVEGAPISAGWLAANAESFAASAPSAAAHVTPIVTFVEPGPLSPEIARECDAQILVADPPRTGIPDAEMLFSQSKASRLVLVSCDVATGARDLKKAIDAGFRLLRLQPIDAFARTTHLEWVATLTRDPT